MVAAPSVVHFVRIAAAVVLDAGRAGPVRARPQGARKMTSEPAIGPRIAQLRRDKGLTQVEFAEAIERSPGWVSQVERGVRRVDRLPVLERLADVLGVTIAELRPELTPSTRASAARSPPTRASSAPRSKSVVPHPLTAVRELLIGHPAIATLAKGGTAKIAKPPSLRALQADAQEAWNLADRQQWPALAALLQARLAVLEATAATSRRGSKVFGVLSRMYQAAATALSLLGDFETAWIAVDRAMTAAIASDSFLAVVAGHLRLAEVLARAGRFGQALATIDTALAALKERRFVSKDREHKDALVLQGALLLARAKAYAKTDDWARAAKSISLAADAALQLDDTHRAYDTSFGRMDVALHQLEVAVILSDAGSALALAKAIDVERLSSRQRGRALVHVAAAHTQRHDVEKAIDALLEAEKRLARGS